MILSTIPLIACASAANMITSKGFIEKTREAVSEAGQIASEAIQNIRTVVAFTNEDNIFDSFSKKLEIPYKMGVRTALISSVLLGLSQVVVYGSFALGCWYGGKLIRDGEISFLDMIRFACSDLKITFQHLYGNIYERNGPWVQCSLESNSGGSSCSCGNFQNYGHDIHDVDFKRRTVQCNNRGNFSEICIFSLSRQT